MVLLIEVVFTKNKVFLTIDNQINLIKNKKIKVNALDKRILKRINYYTLMTYKNILYENGKEHFYKKGISLNDFYKLYKYDIQLKQELLIILYEIKNKYINIISNYFGNNIKNFLEKGYLNKSLYKSNIIFKVYEKYRNSNYEVSNYYEMHKFIPIWVLLNYISYKEFMEYLIDFKDNSEIKNLNNDLILFSIILFEKICSGEITLDIKYKNLKLNDLLIWFKEINIQISKIVNIYTKMEKNIQSINKEDIYRISRIRLGEKNVK